jgi:hypothetical protein
MTVIVQKNVTGRTGLGMNDFLLRTVLYHSPTGCTEILIPQTRCSVSCQIEAMSQTRVNVKHNAQEAQPLHISPSMTVTDS